jgi:hypothetical protein
MMAPARRTGKRLRLIAERAFLTAEEAKLEAKRAALGIAPAPVPSRLFPPDPSLPEPSPSEPLVARGAIESAKSPPTRLGDWENWETERPSRSSTSSRSREATLVEVARGVVEEMAAAERRAYQLAFWLARAFKARGPRPGHKLLSTAAAAALEHASDYPLCEVEPIAYLEADDLALEIEAIWPRIRNTATVLELAARAAPASAPRFTRFLAIAWELQKLVGDADICLPQRRLAALLGCTQRQVSTYIDVAVARGWLARVSDDYAPGRRAKTYRVTAACPRPTP